MAPLRRRVCFKEIAETGFNEQKTYLSTPLLKIISIYLSLTRQEAIP